MQEQEDDRLETLRRRLYRPDATEEDRQRFAALIREAPAEEPERPEDGGRPDPADDEDDSAAAARAPRHRLRAVLAVVVGIAVVAGIVVAGRSGQPDPQVSRAVPSAHSTVPTDLPPPSTAAPTATPVDLVLGGVPTAAERFHGTGSTVVRIAATRAPARGGRIVVLLASSERGALGWFATRLSTRTDRVRFSEVVAASDAAGDREHPFTLSSEAYSGSPPTRLAVQAPDDAAWTLTVALLPRSASRP